MVLFLLACDAPESDPAVTPAAGWYDVARAAELRWSCGVDPDGTDSYDEADDAGATAPARSSDLAEVSLRGGMTWRWADAYSALGCSLDGLAFECLVYETSLQGDGAARAMDAVLIERERLVARWAAPEELAGAVIRTVDCQGSDCDLLAADYPPGFAFPCEGERSFTGWLVD